MKTCLYCGKELKRTGINSYNRTISKYCSKEHRIKYHNKNKPNADAKRYKVCYKCKKKLHISKFQVSKAKADGFQAACRSCYAKRYQEMKAQRTSGGSEALLIDMKSTIFIKPYLSRRWV